MVLGISLKTWLLQIVLNFATRWFFLRVLVYEQKPISHETVFPFAFLFPSLLLPFLAFKLHAKVTEADNGDNVISS